MSTQAEIEAAVATFVADLAELVRNAALEHVRRALSDLRGGRTEPARPARASGARRAEPSPAAPASARTPPVHAPFRAPPSAPPFPSSRAPWSPTGPVPAARPRGIAPVAPAGSVKLPPRAGAAPQPGPKAWAPTGPASNFSPWAPTEPPRAGGVEPRSPHRRGRPPGRRSAAAPVVEAAPVVAADAAAEAQAPAEPLPAARWVVVRRKAKDRPEGAEVEAKPAADVAGAGIEAGAQEPGPESAQGSV